MSKPHIYLGNLTYSSWSMRPWLVLKKSGIEFEDTMIPLRTDEFAQKIGALSPTKLVPVLHVDGAQITDSLAISEWAAEQTPSLWPSDPTRRAEARSATAQMHSGFQSIRSQFPVNLNRDSERTGITEATLLEIQSMEDLWARYLSVSGGPFLFGDWCIADAFFTPVATRFRSYRVSISEQSQAYCDRLLNEPEFLEWEDRAGRETDAIEAFDTGIPGFAPRNSN